MSNVLISYYSRSGTSRQAAKQLQQLTGWSIGEVRDVRPRTGLGGDLRCVIESLLTRSAPSCFVIVAEVDAGSRARRVS